MSLVFKKRDYSAENENAHTAESPRTKGSALSLLLEQSKDTEPKQNNRSNPPSPNATTPYKSPVNSIAGRPIPEGKPVPVAEPQSSVKIPSSSYRRSSIVQSSLQQQRNLARTGDTSLQGTPNSSLLSTSAGYGHLFGAGEIGNVSSPRHYSIPITKEKFDPGSVEERFIVQVPSTPSASAARKGSISSLTKSMSKASLSRSSSRSSTSSFTSLRRFMDKPWKNDDYGSPESVAVSVNSGVSPQSSNRRSRKNSVISFRSGDDDIYSKDVPWAGSDNSNGDSHLGSTPNASLSQLEQAYASTYHGQNSSSGQQRRRQSLKAYGKLGKTLGEGAGGHVKIIRSNTDGKMYAVKEFRARHPNESLRDYNKKVGAEYCLGLTLKHPNIVNTVDIIYETETVHQIMEYGAYDLFAIVMSGKMSVNEVYCDFRQLMEGIRYLHNLGLAHRDLKLDNCVVTERGIVKLIDFGSSVVFKYPESDKIYDCDGVVGSDPYLAPEAAGKGKRYSPSPTDIWSAAIVLCCMLMRKFPWKSPRMSDAAFKAFIAEEEDGSRQGLSKLLVNLPQETHELLGGMLDLDPESRYTIDQCWSNEFMHKDSHCTLNSNNELIPAPNHTHTSVSFEDAHIAMLDKKNRKAKKGEKMW